MPDGPIALVVGLTAAMATIVVAWIGARSVRKDDREHLMRDIEVVGRLAEGSRTRRILEAHIEDRVERLVVRELTQRLRFKQAIFFALAEGSLVAVAVWAVVDKPENARIALNWFAALSVIAFIVCTIWLRCSECTKRKGLNTTFSPT